ncbi:hypothetical protein BS78_05G237900 [Paspalum vaginatum]|nr:hypothetical protein BS78_05G237900 [Paspalum vaginatum]
MEDDAGEAVSEAEEAAAGMRKRKRAGVEGDGDGFGCAYDKDLLLRDEEGGDTTNGVADEDAVAEVMRWQAEISPAPEQELGFVTINGKEESCRPSFSAVASSVMASVDTRVGTPPVPWPWPEPEPQRVPDAGAGVALAVARARAAGLGPGRRGRQRRGGKGGRQKGERRGERKGGAGGERECAGWVG